MSIGKDQGKVWGKKTVGMPSGHSKNRTKAKAQPRPGYKKRPKR